MADVTTPPVAAPAAASPQAPAQAPVGEAALTKLPEKLQNLTRAVVVTGTVAGETPEGLTRVRTAAGEVEIKLPTPLPADKPVTLQIPAGSPPTKAMVLAQPLSNPPAAAPPPPAVAAPLQNPASALLQSATAVTPQPAQLPAVGTFISAVVLAANPRPTGVAPGAGASATAGAGQTAPKADGAAGKGAPAEGASAMTGGSGPARLAGGGGATSGQPVELGGDAAHRGTMLDPAPAAPRGSGQGGAPQDQPAGEEGDGARQGQKQSQTPGGQELARGRPNAPSASGEGGALGGSALKTGQAAEKGAAATPAASAPTAAPAPGADAKAPGAADPRRPMVGLPTADFGAPSAPPAATRSPLAPLPSTTPAPPQSGSPETAPSTSSPSRQAPTSSPASSPAPAPEPPLLRQGQTLAFKVAAAAPPLAPQMAVPAPEGMTEGMIEGTVAGTTPQGKPILAVRDGMLALNTDAKLPVGARLTLQIADPSLLAAQRPPALADGLPDYLQGRDWPALKMALAALRDIDPALAHQFLAAAMPQPNRKLGAALTFLISAMRGGDARGWLGGDAVRALRDGGKEDLLQNIEREFASKEKQAAEKLPDDWRGETLPMYDQTGINPMHIYIHPFPEPEEEKKKAGGGKGTRFVLDVELSKLGPLQLDGMVKPPQFDLILRSKTALSPELRLELREIFANCLGAVGYAGGITFQSDLRAWVRLARAGSSGASVSA